MTSAIPGRGLSGSRREDFEVASGVTAFFASPIVSGEILDASVDERQVAKIAGNMAIEVLLVAMRREGVIDASFNLSEISEALTLAQEEARAAILVFNLDTAGDGPNG